VSAKRRKPVRVLFVEDNPGDARLVKEALAETPIAEFELTHVQHLQEGLRRLARHKFDVVLLDLLLDGTPRLGALLEIYEQSARVPVVVLRAEWNQKSSPMRCGRLRSKGPPSRQEPGSNAGRRRSA